MENTIIFELDMSTTPSSKILRISSIHASIFADMEQQERRESGYYLRLYFDEASTIRTAKIGLANGKTASKSSEISWDDTIELQIPANMGKLQVSLCNGNGIGDSMDEKDDPIDIVAVEVVQEAGSFEHVLCKGSGPVCSFSVSFQSEVVLQDAAKYLQRTKSSTQFITSPNAVSLCDALLTAKRVAGDAQKALTLHELLQRGACIIETPRGVTRLSAIPDAERASIVSNNRRVLGTASRALAGIADDADEHLVSLLCRQLFQRALARETMTSSEHRTVTILRATSPPLVSTARSRQGKSNTMA